MPPGLRRLYLTLGCVWLAVAAASLLIGTTGTSLAAYWHQASGAADPVMEILRQLSALALPRLLMGMLAGGSLAVAGAMFQSLFRNPLASPYTLGVSSGASLGAALAIMAAGGGLWHGVPMVSVMAFLGAVVCVGIVYGIARVRPGQATGTLLLAGLTLGFISSALIVLVMFLAEIRDSDQILRWMMGSLEVVGMSPVYESLALAALAGGVATYLHRDLDLLMMGEVVAASRGVAVRHSRRLIYFSASLLTAGVVAHVGPIGFVCLLVPHICRALVGPTHGRLIPACALGGAAFLPLCDLLARNAMWWLAGETRQIPVGVLTSLIGGSFFLYLLLARRDRSVVR
ncbi:MAG TPA: iron ABC transporter permease [Phycisphaerae bacterium]|nr:iron ABC transporter permease [Phycisphaerae bacterium]HRY70135.1 iron ABC transporter permease [Phycisphaerae bacterium]HSA28275.1 iron ABC transporter permease [Phycisphaerae bacterium]